MELVASRPAPLEVRDQGVHQPFSLAKLGGRHAVELAVAEDLATGICVGRDDDAFDRRFVVRLVALAGDGRAAILGAHRCAFLARLRRRGSLNGLVGRDFVVAPQRRWARIERQVRSASTPPGIERGVVDRPVVAAPDEDGGTGALTCSRSAMSTRVSARAKSTAAPRSIDSRTARNDRPNPTASPNRRRPSTSGPNGDRTMAGSVMARFSDRRRPRSGSGGSPRRGPGGCLPRT
jgi:hypothetical protein